nr:reverse transcriptase domain-containing protein [Tanacetum cinerariifolium]
MSTRSSVRNLFPPLDNTELTIRRRSRADPTLLNDLEMAAEGNGDPLVPDLRTMEELCQPSLNGRGGPITSIAIQATNFGLKNDMVQQVQNSCQFHGLPGDDANKHLDKFLHVTQSIKVNEVTDDALCLNLMRVLQVNQQVKAVTPNRETCGGPHSYNDCPATIDQPRTYMLREPTKANDAILKNMQTNMTSFTNSNIELKNMFGQFVKMNTASSSGSKTLPVNTITNPKEDLKGITTRSKIAYQGPTIPTTSSSLPKVVERETEVTKDTVPPTNNGSTKDVQPPVVQTETPIQNSEPVVALIIKPVVAPVSALKSNQKPSIPYPSRLHDQTLRDKANDQKEKFFQIFQDLNFNISFADALILMPKFGLTIKTLLTNKDKLYELARTPLNEHCSVVLLKKLPEKLGDPGKFLIPLWNKLSLPELSPTCITLELTDRSISHPVGVAEDVFVKVGTFHFPADFIVVDFDVDPRVPLILERSFLKTGRALIDVFEGELTLRVGKEAITFNLDQTSRYSANYNDMTANQINVIDMACEEYSQEVLGFFDVIVSGNPTLYCDPIISTSSPTLTLFGDSNFLLEEVDAFLALEDDSTSPEVDHSWVKNVYNLTNTNPSLPPPTQENYFPQVRKELKICEAKNDKFSIDEPPEVELKDLPPHLEYASLEGNDKLPLIIAKDLSVEEKAALIKVLKSHKQAIAWKLFDIKGINPEFCTHKILMEDDFEPAVQHQRRVNLKIYDVIKRRFLDSLDRSKYTKNLEKAKKERDELKLILEKLQNSSKSLNTLLESQENISDKGYHAVPLPFTGNYMPPKRDLRLINEHFESVSVDVISNIAPSDVKTVKIVDVNHKDDEGEEEISLTVEVKTVKPSVEKIKYGKHARETVKNEESPKQHKHHPRGNQRNWNNLMSQRLGSNFKMINKACYVCGSFKHLQYDCDQRVVKPVWNNTRRVNHKNSANKFTHPHPKRRFVPQAVLTSEDARLKLKDLMELCTKLSDRVLDLEKIKSAQAKKIADLKKRVKKLEEKEAMMDAHYELAARLRAEKKTTNQSLKEESNMILSDLSNHSTRSEEVFGYILLVKIKLLIKKLDDLQDEYQV